MWTMHGRSFNTMREAEDYGDWMENCTHTSRSRFDAPGSFTLLILVAAATSFAIAWFTG